MKRSQSKIFAEFNSGVKRHMGDTEPGAPDCMYWLKHVDAALIVATLRESAINTDLDGAVRRWHYDLAAHIAEQWNAYERAEAALPICDAPEQHSDAPVGLPEGEI